jgi:hypothetical protein
MESAGFILLFVGVIYLIFPGINLRFSKNNAVTKGKIDYASYKKTIRLGGAVFTFIGIALLVLSHFLNAET